MPFSPKRGGLFMAEKKIFEENGYKWCKEKTDETPYYINLEYKGKIWCDYRLFRLYKRMNEQESKAADNESRCLVFNKNKLLVKCRLNCETECPYGPNHGRTGKPVSLDSIQEKSNFDFADSESDPDEEYSERETFSTFAQTIAKLDKTDRLIYLSIRMKGKTEREIAKELGISQPAVHKRLVKTAEYVKKNMAKFVG
jgi:RNA polymerase sigma factor (sigma-70 family)